jgi:hypothetical protein
VVCVQCFPSDQLDSSTWCQQLASSSVGVRTECVCLHVLTFVITASKFCALLVRVTLQDLTRTLIILNATSGVFPCQSSKLIHMTASDAQSQQCCSRQQVTVSCLYTDVCVDQLKCGRESNRAFCGSADSHTEPTRPSAKGRFETR